MAEDHEREPTRRTQLTRPQEPHTRVLRLLNAIPRGDRGGEQNLFRADAEVSLMNLFGNTPEHPAWSALQEVEGAAERARERSPGFEPVFDRELLHAG